LKTALFQQAREEKKVLCSLCSHRCLIPDGKRGICAVRENRGGLLYSLVYDKIIARHVDPIEKKPLFHFLPGSLSYSIATPGCNFRCLHCQNADISQLPRDRGGAIPGEEFPPSSIAEQALASGCASISYTYTEPTMYFELAYDTARVAQERGIKNVFVTNGYITAEALDTIAPFLHAANIDLKGFSEQFYRKVCGARLQPVLDAIKLYKKSGIWIEITTLVIPGQNDSEQELREIAEFIGSVGQDIPWHVSRFHPAYKLLDQPVTPVETLKKARDIGIEAGLRYVYQGNVPGEGEDTSCWNCRQIVVKRFGYRIIENKVKEGKCGHCGTALDGVWK
jgi:pyruvate formate lyase activating enzyme